MHIDIIYFALIGNGLVLMKGYWDQQKSSIIERVSSGQGFIIHYVDYIWDSVSVHYRGVN